ncbi:MAG: MopE-related protein [Myxococcota bacterium]|nr:MopE-related protein [Myxococcota bacterium]
MSCARMLRAAALASLAWAMVGCELDPYCLTCVEGEDAGGIDAGDGGGLDGGGGRIDASELDAGEEPDGCVAGTVERCNERDDDCDGMVDEGIDTATSLEHCGGCSLRCAPLGAFGECVDGVCQVASCDVGRFDLDMDPTNGCEYRCLATDPTDARCDRRDNDCDGTIDEDFDLTSDPLNCGACGRVCATAHAASSCAAGACTLGACEPGYYDLDGVPTNGCEYACTLAAPATEACNLRDDDCDGRVDEGDPGGGGMCGTSTGECVAGVERCVAGAIACMGGVSPTTEICNGGDDDCDTRTDEGNPEGGTYCGSGEGACEPGREQCTGGALVCVGATGPAAETCNAVDDDCDTRIDEGNPGGGGSCGTSTGACTAGALSCVSGSIVCLGGTGPMLESCNGGDDDCDARTDEDFLLAVDPRNCGMCGRVCSFPSSVALCTSGTCGIGACVPGFVDADGLPGNGCEYGCVPSGAEVCNGRDDDCDTRSDEGLTPPSTFCNPNGVCASTSARCGGPSGWVCDYPAATYQATETRCDGLDNDCDGRVDDPFPSLGTSCNNGEIGACRRVGSFVCNAAGIATRCNAMASGGGVAETCNGLDDDCDGTLDESAPGAWVQITGSFGTRWIMSYEASRPNATTSSAGSLTHRVCSEPGRLPWTNVTYAQAQAACATQGARLCTEPEWQRACQTTASTACTWSYSSSCTTFSSARCNGNELDTNTGASGDQDDVLATGALPMCYANWGSTAARIYDMSGNVAEWAAARSSGVNPLRGGSSTSPQGGTTCGFDFVVAGNTFATPGVGFRCCRDTAP